MYFMNTLEKINWRKKDSEKQWNLSCCRFLRMCRARLRATSMSAKLQIVSACQRRRFLIRLQEFRETPPRRSLQTVCRRSPPLRNATGEQNKLSHYCYGKSPLL